MATPMRNLTGQAGAAAAGAGDGEATPTASSASAAHTSAAATGTAPAAHNTHTAPSSHSTHNAHNTHTTTPSMHQAHHQRPARHQSLTHAQVQEILLKAAGNTGGAAGGPDPRFRDRDWQRITLGELLTSVDSSSSSTSAAGGASSTSAAGGGASTASDAAASKDETHISQGVIDADVKWVDGESCSVEDGTNLLLSSGAPVLLLRRGGATTTTNAAAGGNSSSTSMAGVTGTFDFRDLNQYLLFATGQLHPADEEQLHVFQALAQRAQTGQKITLCEAKALGTLPGSPPEAIVSLPRTARLSAAVERFGGGVHRIVVVKESPDREVLGILSQLRLVRFLWEHGRSFPVIDQLYGKEIRDLAIGSQTPISINGDRPLKEALTLMNNEAITSLAVVDNQHQVVGNISNADVRHLTKSSSAPLLENTCIHFVSVILSTRGLADGKDSFPVFYITPYSTLAHTIAKLIATKSHRMWVVDATTPNSSTPSTPLPSQSGHTQPPFFSGGASTSSHQLPHHFHKRSNSSSVPSATPDASSTATPAVPPPTNTTTTTTSPHAPLSQPAAAHPPHLAPSTPQATPPFHPVAATPSVSAAALPGQHLSGKLSGVVSLTDILNLFARASGLHPEDPEDMRRRRRGSSSSSRSSRIDVLSSAGIRR